MKTFYKKNNEPGFVEEIERRNEVIEKNPETLVPWEGVRKQMKE